jgi:hypothetical protein
MLHIQKRHTMMTLLHAFSRTFPTSTVKGFSTVFIVLAFPIFYLNDTLAFSDEDTLAQAVFLLNHRTRIMQKKALTKMK